MNILYIAYSCSPCRGSEDQIGWNLPMAMARFHRVTVITKEEHRPQIEAWQAEGNVLPFEICYADIPGWVKGLCRGMAYSLRLQVWQKQALQLAKSHCRREKTDVIHQITPVEFRAVGDYGQIENVCYVCGPVGGGEYIPRQLLRRAGTGLVFEPVRWAANCLFRRGLKRRGILARCDRLLFANVQTARWLQGDQRNVYPEVGIGADGLQPVRQQSGESCHFLTAGRLVYRKGHTLLLEALSGLPRDGSWHCTVVGGGPWEKALMRMCRRKGLEAYVSFLPRVPHSRMEDLYRRASVLVMPSLRETTGSVLLEAMARGIPPVAVKGFGADNLVTKDSGWLCGPSAESLRRALIEAMDATEAARRGIHAAKAAQHHTWEKKARYYEELYRQCLEEKEGAR